MEKEERDRRYSGLIGIFLNSSLEYGFLIDEGKDFSNEFICEFARRPEVSRTVDQFIQQIKGLLSLTRQKYPAAVKSQPILADNRNLQKTDSEILKPNHTGNSRIIKNGSDAEKFEIRPADFLQPQSTFQRSGNDNEVAASNQQIKATTSPSQLYSKQLPQKTLPINNYGAIIDKLSVPGVVPVDQYKKTSALNQSRTQFSIATNGKVNEPFRCRIESLNATKAEIFIQGIDIPEESGLTFDQASGEIFGTPRAAGDYKIKVYFRFEQPSNYGQTLLEGECPLIINPDPKTLWINKPSDENDPYWKKDEDSLIVKSNDGLRMIAASKRGRSHAHVGSFRDDDFCLVGQEINGWRVLAVADGAGSSKKSRWGSRIACKKGCEYIFKNFVCLEQEQKIEEALAIWKTDKSDAAKLIKNELYYIFGQAAQTAVRFIDDEAKSKGVPYRDYSTTLLIAIHKKFDVGHFIGTYWVGDGAIGLFNRHHGIRVMGRADTGEFAGQTRFLDSTMVNDAQEIWNRINFEIVPEFTALAVMTDGISDPFFETDTDLEKLLKWDQFWEQIEPILYSADPEANLLAWLDFWSSGNHDDRTIAILCADK